MVVMWRCSGVLITCCLHRKVAGNRYDPPVAYWKLLSKLYPKLGALSALRPVAPFLRLTPVVLADWCLACAHMQAQRRDASIRDRRKRGSGGFVRHWFTELFDHEPSGDQEV